MNLMLIGFGGQKDGGPVWQIGTLIAGRTDESEEFLSDRSPSPHLLHHRNEGDSCISGPGLIGVDELLGVTSPMVECASALRYIPAVMLPSQAALPVGSQTSAR
jgi:hypothetical protein